MKGSVKTVFPGNNSVEGFYSFYESGLSTTDYVYILKGGPGTGKSSFMRQLAENFRDRGCDVELWQCSSDSNSLDGVVIPAYKTAVIDGTAPHVVDPRYPGVREEIINFGEFWKEGALQKERDAIMALTDRISAAFGRAYEHLDAAGKADAELLGCRRAEEKTLQNEDTFVREIFGAEQCAARHLFGAAVTPDGVKDLTFDLCRSVKKRWFLQGKRGLGQQRYLQALLDRAEKRGVSAEIYHGYLDPQEILLVIFPDLDIAVAAAENVPSVEMREGDRLLTFRAEADPHLREKEKQAEKRRDDAVADAVAEIHRAHVLHDDLETYYISAMDFEKITNLGKNIMQKILKKV